MKRLVIGLESSSIMPLIAVSPLTQDCYETIWGRYLSDTLIVHNDSIDELKNIFNFKGNTFFSNPTKRMEKIRDFHPRGELSLKGAAMKLLLDGQMGGWVGNKNSRVQTFFFSDVVDAIGDDIRDPAHFAGVLVERMEAKVARYNHMLTPANGTLTVDIGQILPYWGFHNVSPSLFTEKRTLKIQVLPDSESSEMFKSYPSATRRDAYHYHMLKKERVELILVGDANYSKNICSCQGCRAYECDIKVLKDTSRKLILNLT